MGRACDRRNSLTLKDEEGKSQGEGELPVAPVQERLAQLKDSLERQVESGREKVSFE